MNNIYTKFYEFTDTCTMCYDNLKQQDLQSEKIQKLLIDTLEKRIKNLRKEVEERKISKLGKVVKLKVG